MLFFLKKTEVNCKMGQIKHGMEWNCYSRMYNKVTVVQLIRRLVITYVYFFPGCLRAPVYVVANGNDNLLCKTRDWKNRQECDRVKSAILHD
jgi:hypothetical protein